MMYKVKLFLLLAAAWILGIMFAMAVFGSDQSKLTNQITDCQKLVKNLDTAYVVAENSFADMRNLAEDIYYLKITSVKYEGDLAYITNVFYNNHKFYEQLSKSKCFMEVKND